MHYHDQQVTRQVDRLVTSLRLIVRSSAKLRPAFAARVGISEPNARVWLSDPSGPVAEGFPV